MSGGVSVTWARAREYDRMIFTNHDLHEMEQGGV